MIPVILIPEINQIVYPARGEIGIVLPASSICRPDRERRGPQHSRNASDLLASAGSSPHARALCSRVLMVARHRPVYEALPR